MTHAGRRWVETLARAGFGVKGALYLLLGGLALQFAVGAGGRLGNAYEAVAAVRATSYGQAIVGVVAIGLALYAAWRFLEAFADANGKGRDAGGLASRAVYALSGAVYAVLAIDAAILAFAPGSRNGSTELPATLTGSVLAQWAAMLIAAGLVIYGIAQLRRSFSSSLSDRLSLHRVERDIGRWPVRVSRAGIAGRAVVLIMLGVVLARRATTSVDAASQTDTGDSLRVIAALPTGQWLLACVAAGLMAYGVFQLVQARYRRISPP